MGGCFSLGSFMISWMSRKKDTISLSSVKAEYVAACEVRKEAVWLRKLLSDLFEGSMDPTVTHCGNTSCICFYEDPIFHGKTTYKQQVSLYSRASTKWCVAAIVYLH